MTEEDPGRWTASYKYSNSSRNITTETSHEPTQTTCIERTMTDHEVHPRAPLRTNPTPTEQNHPGWIVQKYGGTSVGKFLPNVATHTLPAALDAGHRVALVCSARSGTTKSTGTTNLLLQAAVEALEPPTQSDEPPLARSTFARISNDNINGPNPLILSQILGRNSSTPKLLSRSNSGFMSPNYLFNSNTNHSSHLSSPTGWNPSHSTLVESSDSVTTATTTTNTTTTTTATEPDEFLQPMTRFDRTIELVKIDHLKAASLLISDPELLSELNYHISYDCERLRSLLLAAQILEEISPKSKDLIIGVGEKLSCRIVTAYLIDQGFDAELVCLDNIVEKIEKESNEADSSENILETLGGQLRQPFYDRLALKLGERLKNCGNRIPVITGFFGVVPGSLLAQVGRGYTDLCASLCAVGLGAVELQVWKEVDGIFTADPRKVPKAQLLSVVTPEEAAELTYYGSEVIHPFTMEQVIRASIPIRIKNVMNPDGVGTIIYPSRSIPSSPTLVEMPTTTDSKQNNNNKAPTAITIKENIVVLNVHSNQKTISHGFFARIFGTLDKFGVVVDLISTSEVHVSMAIMVTEAYRFKGFDRLVKELKDIGGVSVLDQMAILSLVGRKMKNMVGIAGKMFTTLAAGNVNIEMISQGASEINISCVISKEDSIKALNLVHDTLVINF